MASGDSTIRRQALQASSELLLEPLTCVQCLQAGICEPLVSQLQVRTISQHTASEPTVSRTVRVCVAFQLRVSVAVLLELTELATPVERPCLCCNTHYIRADCCLG